MEIQQSITTRPYEQKALPPSRIMVQKNQWQVEALSCWTQVPDALLVHGTRAPAGYSFCFVFFFFGKLQWAMEETHGGSRKYHCRDFVPCTPKYVSGWPFNVCNTVGYMATPRGGGNGDSEERDPIAAVPSSWLELRFLSMPRL